MAKATAICRCAKCGVTFEMENRYCYNRSDANSWEEWAQDNITTCPKCYKEERKEAEANKIAQSKQEHQLPDLMGSDKQIAWADKIRYVKISEAVRIIAIWNADIASAREEGVRKEECDEITKKVEYASDCMRQIDSASWWIEHRNHDADQLLSDFVAEYDAHEQQENVTEYSMPTSESEVKSTQKPAIAGTENPTKDGIAKITVNSNVIMFAYDRDSDFINAMHDHECEWTDRKWQKKVSDTTPAAADLVAEIGADLINRGFVVEFPAQEMMDKAISGDYEIEHHRWICQISTGEHAGWFSIRWPGRDDSLYQAARQIKGSKYSRPRVVVPPARWRELLDFCDSNDFRISPAAQSIIDDQRDKINN